MTSSKYVYMHTDVYIGVVRMIMYVYTCILPCVLHIYIRMCVHLYAVGADCIW